VANPVDGAAEVELLRCRPAISRANADAAVKSNTCAGVEVGLPDRAVAFYY
jgi:hypothetical protein